MKGGREFDNSHLDGLTVGGRKWDPGALAEGCLIPPYLPLTPGVLDKGGADTQKG